MPGLPDFSLVAQRPDLLLQWSWGLPEWLVAMGGVVCSGHLSVFFRLEVTLNLSLDFCFLKPVVSIGGGLMPRPPLASWVQLSGVRPQHGNFEKLPRRF